MHPLAVSYVLFAVWVASWLAAAIWTRRTQARSSFGQELIHRVPTVIGAVAVTVATRLRLEGFAPWGLPLAASWALTALVAAGLLFTWWARVTLGDLWSASVTRKEGHHVVERGPYALVRHPIYTGLIGAFFALAIQIGLPLGVVGAALIALGFWLKGRIEERFLSAELGEAAYADYRRRVPMLIPFWPTAL
jgi:protein-S-isoprenylcysteine O-methyltransferase Ste14